MIIFIHENNLDNILREVYNSTKEVPCSYSEFLTVLDSNCDIFVFSWGIIIYDKVKGDFHIEVLEEYRGKWDKSDAEKVITALPKPVTAPIHTHNIRAQNFVLHMGFKFLSSDDTYNTYIKE